MAEDEGDESLPAWQIATKGIKLIINNKNMEGIQLLLENSQNLEVFSAYSLAVVMDAIMIYEEDKLAKAISTLQELERRCREQNSKRSVGFSLFHSTDYKVSLADYLQAQIILADTQVCYAILTFLFQDVSGFFKGGWILRRAWKLYQKVYKDIQDIYRCKMEDTVHAEFLTGMDLKECASEDSADWDYSDPVIAHHGCNKGYKLPHSKSAYDAKNLTCQKLKKSMSLHNGALRESRGFWPSFNPLNFASSLLPSAFFPKRQQETVDEETIKRLMAAVSFGYGLFNLGVSLLPPTLLAITKFLGFGVDKETGIKCLMFSRLGSDMRAPLARLSLLWYQCIIRPYHAVDGAHIAAGAEAAEQLLKEVEVEFADSALFLFFRGRMHRIKSEIPEAIIAFQMAIRNSVQREITYISRHEIGWCYMINLDYCKTEESFIFLKTNSRWCKKFYIYMSLISTGACDNQRRFELTKELLMNMNSAGATTQIDQFLTRRAKICSHVSRENPEDTHFWKLLVFEMLYLWNTLPSCSPEVLETILAECQLTEGSEPMPGLAQLIAGAVLIIMKRYEEAIEEFRHCIEQRQSLPYTSEDSHISAFALFELAELLSKNPEDVEEAKECLMQIDNYSKFDFENKVTYRAEKLSRTLN